MYYLAAKMLGRMFRANRQDPTSKQARHFSLHRGPWTTASVRQWDTRLGNGHPTAPAKARLAFVFPALSRGDSAELATCRHRGRGTIGSRRKRPTGARSRRPARCDGPLFDGDGSCAGPFPGGSLRAPSAPYCYGLLSTLSPYNSMRCPEPYTSAARFRTPRHALCFCEHGLTVRRCYACITPYEMCVRLRRIQMVFRYGGVPE
jgi:hypothetical protein